jgi:hypothetical protein
VGYFRFFYNGRDVGNLDTCLEGYFSIFIITEVGNLLEKITDLMVIIIRVVALTVE